jgi:ABC-type histidine transport system ATPase subunit
MLKEFTEKHLRRRRPTKLQQPDTRRIVSNNVLAESNRQRQRSGGEGSKPVRKVIKRIRVKVQMLLQEIKVHWWLRVVVLPNVKGSQWGQ